MWRKIINSVSLFSFFFFLVDCCSQDKSSCVQPGLWWAEEGGKKKTAQRRKVWEDAMFDYLRWLCECIHLVRATHDIYGRKKIFPRVWGHGRSTEIKDAAGVRATPRPPDSGDLWELLKSLWRQWPLWVFCSWHFHNHTHTPVCKRLWCAVSMLNLIVTEKPIELAAE